MAASSSGFEGARHRLADSSEMRTLCTNRSQPARRPRPIRTVALKVSLHATTPGSGGGYGVECADDIGSETAFV